MDEFEEKKRGKIVLISLAAAAFLGALLLVLFWAYLEGLQQDKNKELSLPESASPFVVEKQEEPGRGSSENDQGAEVVEELADHKEEVSSSENFQIRDVRFGGAVAAASGNDEIVPLEILEIKGTTVSSSDKKDNKILISWKTSKLAVSTVEYSKNDSNVPMKFSETDYGFNHGLVISGLEPGIRYIYSIKSKDRWGNEKSSEKHVAYINDTAGSILEVIANELDDIFGWAMKK